MKWGGSKGDRDEEWLDKHYGSSHPESGIGSHQNRFNGFSQDYETLQTHACEKKLPTPLYEWKDALIGEKCARPPAQWREFGHALLAEVIANQWGQPVPS